MGIKRFELKDYEVAALAFQNAARLAPEGSREAIMLEAQEAHFALQKIQPDRMDVHH